MTVDFGTLVVIVLAGLGGPLLAVLGRGFVPVVVGEILAGVLAGPDVLGVVHPGNEIVSALGEIGFAMLMLTVGMHMPLREPRLGKALGSGAVLAAIVALLAVPAGILAELIAGGGHAAVYALVLASGSAAVVLPAFQEAGMEGPRALVVMAQVALADVATIIAVPIVLQPGRVGHALLGGLLVAGAALLLLAATRAIPGDGWVHDVRRLSKKRHWALDLRLSLLVLFVLAWLAQKGGTSVLIAGFSAGLMVAAVGGPKRLSTQMRGVAEGFFVPLYFVVLGASLDIGGLLSNPTLSALVGALVALNVVIHLLAAALRRRSLADGLVATAQLGVPAAVASLGLSEHVLSPVEATAIVGAALVSLAVCTLGVSRLVRPVAAIPEHGPPAGAPRGGAPVPG